MQSCSAVISHDLSGFGAAKDNWDVFIFIQAACEQDEDMVHLKNTLGLAVSVLGIAICLVYRNTIVVYQQANKINDKLFDASLITLDDYSI